MRSARHKLTEIEHPGRLREDLVEADVAITSANEVHHAGVRVVDGVEDSRGAIQRLESEGLG